MHMWCLLLNTGGCSVQFAARDSAPTHRHPPVCPQRYGYHDASCFGHALEGNLHLVFAQGFRTKEEVQRFSNLMEEVRELALWLWLCRQLLGWWRSPRRHLHLQPLLPCAQMCHIVANKHSGSLKGEHGTGRNVAPFVEMEWGTKAYDLMWELKDLFDPDLVLNPGALNEQPAQKACRGSGVDCAHCCWPWGLDRAACKCTPAHSALRKV